jgi:hypothetical protein
MPCAGVDIGVGAAHLYFLISQISSDVGLGSLSGNIGAAAFDLNDDDDDDDDDDAGCGRDPPPNATRLAAGGDMLIESRRARLLH